MRYILSLYILSSFFLFGQNGITVGDIDFSYSQPKEYELGPIRVIGADNFDHQAIKLIAGLRQGQKIILPGNDISNAIKNLWNEEIFSNVAIYVTKEIAGIVYLTIAVEARMKLSKFSFKGIGKRDADKLREEIKLFTGKTITENLVFQTKAKIRGYFREKGFFNTKVDISRVKDTLINSSEIFIIKIEKGNKIGIKEIVISGNTEIPTWKLKMAMKDTKQRGILQIFKRSKFTESSYEKDKLSLLAKFNKVGLRDASISFDTVYQLNSKNLMIEINITEGEKYYFGDIEWLGNTKYRSSFLDTVLGIKKGDLYNRNLFEQRLNGSGDGRDINSLYMDQGYLFFQVMPVEINVNQNMINYQIRIIEGKEARNGTITIKGNTKTNDYVILREIRTKPGDLFNKGDIMRTQRELAQLGYFNEQAFQVNPLPNPSKGTVDIEYVVEEKNSDQIELSGGYGGAGPTSSGRIIGTLGLTFNNFSTRNFFKKNAWSPLPGGDGQRLSMRAQSNGRFYQSYTFSFIEPWLGGKKPNSLSFSINHTALSSNGKLRSQDGYAGLSISGVGIGIGKRNKWPDDYFSTIIELGYKYYDVVNDTRFPVFSKGIANDISLQYTIQRSSVSAPTYPQSGSNFTFLSKATLPYSSLTGKDYSLLSPQERYKYLEYYRFKFTAEWFLPLSKDKKLILMSRFGMGYLGAYNKAKGVSPFERYSMGGSGLSGVNQIGGRSILALRGYEDQSISSAGADPIATKYTIELRYPISLNPQATFFALAFLEGGNTYPSFDKFNPFNVKRTAGIGIRVFLPMFGMLGLDYGLGFDKLNSWSSGYGSASDISIGTKGYYPKLSFSIGMNLGEL
ncbi:MAG: outer membrane protein assembly factor BamA [Flavobacteriales bacterium]|nr:outer membrane protein assembly factor BamA [Flavobacteriales bacterium]NDA97745.1 outer membrane protein assembly factor BamA [Flavobacteriia bacterium]NDC28524.1 outer membrane protein assembly factor BamA [Crocinitomicaceae bacterium]